MTKISFVTKNMIFAEDLIQQIERVLPEVKVVNEYPSGDENLVLIDEDKETLKEISHQFKELPLVFLSADKNMVIEADVVIQKPIVLNELLKALKNQTLLPRVRRKECFNIREYSFYPVKKEILSTTSGLAIKLTEKEVAIIKYLHKIAPESADKEDLLENVWNYSASVTTHTIETHIYRLRQKVEKDGGSQLIITENNGYRLNF